MVFSPTFFRAKILQVPEPDRAYKRPRTSASLNCPASPHCAGDEIRKTAPHNSTAPAPAPHLQIERRGSKHTQRAAWHWSHNLTTMGFIRDGYIIDILSVSKDLPPNPLLGYNGTAPPSSAGSLSGMTQSTLAHRVLLNDQRCLITGAVSSQLQACRLINTIHIDESNRAEKLPLKQEIERILTRQQFGVGKFFLDSLPNCIALEAQWHSDLDTYGSFCITIPLEQMFHITSVLQESNQEWDSRAKSDPQALRNLNMMRDPFVVRKCVLLVLRPDVFLPDNRPLSINATRTLRVPGGPYPTRSERSSWIAYYSRSHDSLSIFSLLVNANSKLQNVVETFQPLRQYAAFVSNAVAAIFHVPKEVQDQTLSPIPPVPAVPQAHQPNTVTPRPSSESGKGRDVHHLDCQDCGAAEEGYPTNDFDEDDEDDEPDTIDGLTCLEMTAVLQRVSDGTLSDSERAEAAMLMLGMASGHQRPQALSPLMPDSA